MFRPGRLLNIERELILIELGKKAQQIFNNIVSNNPRGYDLRLLQGALQFTPNVEHFENIYWIDTGDQELNDIAYYFEYGTGLYNTKVRFKTSRNYIYPINAKYLKFRKPWNGIMYASKVTGVHPVFMMNKAIKTIENDRYYLQREIRERLEMSVI